jgi:hypothetical protein
MGRGNRTSYVSSSVARGTSSTLARGTNSTSTAKFTKRVAGERQIQGVIAEPVEDVFSGEGGLFDSTPAEMEGLRDQSKKRLKRQITELEYRLNLVQPDVDYGDDIYPAELEGLRASDTRTRKTIEAELYRLREQAQLIMPLEEIPGPIFEEVQTKSEAEVDRFGGLFTKSAAEQGMSEGELEYYQNEMKRITRNRIVDLKVRLNSIRANQAYEDYTPEEEEHYRAQDTRERNRLEPELASLLEDAKALGILEEVQN